MKKCILCAIGGALAMITTIVIAANISAAIKQKKDEYEHINYVSAITQDECFVCGNSTKDPMSLHWGEDNVGIVNLNTFEVLRLEINRYDDRGELIEEAAGYMQTSSLIDNENESYAHAYTFPDNAYANIDLTGVQYAIDRDLIQSRLCQICLDSINDLWFTDQPPAEYAVISFEDRTIQPLLNSHPWFAAGNFGVDCEFKKNGAIDLLIHYCPNRYE